ncbi:MAG: phosphocholine cytidylyltransferase family protein [Hydrogenophilales bacterium]
MKNYFGMNNLKAIILAAGEGKRLRPLTDNKPKTMVNLFGMSLLERQLITFNDCGLQNLIVVGGYKNETINFSNIKKYTNSDYANTNMVETLFCANEEMNDEIIVSYGDIIYEKNILINLINSNEDISVVIDKNWQKYWELRFTDPLNDAESLKLDSMNNIIEIGQNVKNITDIQGQYIGLMKFKGKGLESVKKFYKKTKEESIKTGYNPLNQNIPFKKSYMTDFIQGLINSGCKIKAISINNGWLELDSNDDYRIYNELYKIGKLSEFFKIDNKN